MLRLDLAYFRVGGWTRMGGVEHIHREPQRDRPPGGGPQMKRTILRCALTTAFCLSILLGFSRATRADLVLTNAPGDKVAGAERIGAALSIDFYADLIPVQSGLTGSLREDGAALLRGSALNQQYGTSQHVFSFDWKFTGDVPTPKDRVGTVAFVTWFAVFGGDDYLAYIPITGVPAGETHSESSGHFRLDLGLVGYGYEVWGRLPFDLSIGVIGTVVDSTVTSPDDTTARLVITNLQMTPTSEPSTLLVMGFASVVVGSYRLACTRRVKLSGDKSELTETGTQIGQKQGRK